MDEKSGNTGGMRRGAEKSAENPIFYENYGRCEYFPWKAKNDEREERKRIHSNITHEHITSCQIHGRTFPKLPGCWAHIRAVRIGSININIYIIYHNICEMILFSRCSFACAALFLPASTLPFPHSHMFHCALFIEIHGK